MKKILIVICGLVLTGALQAQIIHVPVDFPTIQMAIDSAANGDTVLISPGTYLENLYISAKNITLASLYLTTHDTSYISQTILDGNQNGSVVHLEHVDSTFLICGFTITHGRSLGGGGIWGQFSRPTFRNLIIIQNSAYTCEVVCGHGGGIYLFDSHSLMENLKISGNSADEDGGGICLYSSKAIMKNVVISGNSSGFTGGGIGSGSSSLVMSKVTIKDNYAKMAGGLCLGENSVFDTIQRCNIFRNSALKGNDIYSGSLVKIIVDTFSVLSPTRYHAEPLANFTFDIQHSRDQQVNADLYVSPEGNNNNTGLSAVDPLKTIHHAFSIILTDRLNPHVIHLLDGTYSPSANQDLFPLCIPDYISLAGSSPSRVILDADSTGSVFSFDHVVGNGLSGLTITGGNSGYGGGIFCSFSDPHLENLIVKRNTSQNIGSGIYCINSNPIISNSEISYNGRGGGAYFHLSNPVFKNVICNQNTGCGIICSRSNPVMEGVTISGNFGGGLNCSRSILKFDSITRCNIFDNCNVNDGNDLITDTTMHVVLDTFSVLHPVGFHAAPIEKYSFNILHGKHLQHNSDLFVSPAGDNRNSGITPKDPLKTIFCAFSSILADSLNLHSVHLSGGIYSPSKTGEPFPLKTPDYLIVKGESEEKVILDAEGQENTIIISGNVLTHLQNMTIIGTNSLWSYRGAIDIKNSDPFLENLKITNNLSIGIAMNHASPTVNNVEITFNAGTGIYCVFESNPRLNNVVINGNGDDGVECWDISNAILNNVTISHNGNYGLDSYNSSPTLKNVLIIGNPIGLSSKSSSPILENVTFADNGVPGGSCIFLYDSQTILTNSILWNNTAHEIYLGGGKITISYSDLKGGQDSIADNNHGVVQWLEGNIDADPQFSNTLEHPFSLLRSSPCVNAGVPDTTGLNLPATDITDNPRIWNGRVDMGAYEWNNVGTEEYRILNNEIRISNFPNPVVSGTTFHYEVRESCQVRLEIFDSFGRKIAEPGNGYQQQGKQEISWTASALPAGIYFYRMNAGNNIAIGKIVVVK